MQFRIHVADRETGAESEIRLEAPTVQEARAQANEAGYLVSSIEPVAATNAKQVDAPSPAELSPQGRSPSSPSEPDALTAIGGILGLIVGAVIGFKLGGPLGIIVGAICGFIAGMGIGSALTPPSEGSELGNGGRLAIA